MAPEQLSALADRIQKSIGVSLAEQHTKPGPIWFMPLGDDEQAAIVKALNAAAKRR